MQALVLMFGLLATATDAAAAESLSMGSALLQTAWALMVVVGLILALYALARKRPFFSRSGGNAITIIEMRPLMAKATLALVEVRGKEYLLAISATGIHCLADLSPEAAATPKSPDFEALLAEQQ